MDSGSCSKITPSCKFASVVPPIKAFCGLAGVLKEQEIFAKKNQSISKGEKMFKNMNMAAITSIGHF